MKIKYIFVIAIFICALFTQCSKEHNELNPTNTETTPIGNSIKIDTITQVDTIIVSPYTMLNLYIIVNYDAYVSFMHTEYPDTEVPNIESYPDIDFPSIECCGVKDPKWLIDYMKAVSSYEYSLSSLQHANLHLEVSSASLDSVDYLFCDFKLISLTGQVTTRESSTCFFCSGELLPLDLIPQNVNKNVIWKLVIKVQE